MAAVMIKHLKTVAGNKRSLELYKKIFKTLIAFPCFVIISSYYLNIRIPLTVAIRNTSCCHYNVVLFHVRGILEEFGHLDCFYSQKMKVPRFRNTTYILRIC